MRLDSPPAPLLPAAQAVIVGILLSRFNLIFPLMWIILLTVSLMAAGVLIFSARLSKRLPHLTRINRLLLWLTFAALAGLRYHLVYNYYPENHIVRYCSQEQRLATLRGTIVTEPFIAKSSGSLAAFDFIHPPSTIFTLRCANVLGRDGWIETTGLVYVVLSQPHPLLHRGQHVQIDSWIALRPGPDNPGQIDRRDYHHAARNLVACYANYAEAVSILSDSPPRPGLFNQFQQKLKSFAGAALLDDLSFDADDPAADQDSQAFLAALLLGQRYNLTGPLNEIFARTGTLHYLSLSGFHVGLLAAFIWGLTWLLRLPRWLRGLLSLTVIALFILIVPPRAPILRAGIICAVFCLAYMTRRPAHNLNLVAFAALVLLLWRPLDLFSGGFQLSFIVVLGIIIFADALRRRRLRLDNDQQLSMMQPSFRRPGGPDEPLPWWKYLMFAAGKYITGLVVVALIAWLAGMPLIAYHFHRITPWAVVGSVALFPLISLTMLLGFTKLLLVGVFPFMGWLLAWPLRALSDATIYTAELLAQLPYSNINTAAPPVWFIVVFYGLLSWAAWSLRKGKGVPRLTLLALLIWLSAFAWQAPFRPRPQPGQGARLDLLAVGHGCAAVLEMPDGKIICYDAGSNSNFNVGDYTIVPFLRSRGIQNIQAVFISHANIDHYNGVLELCRNFYVAAVYTSEYLPQDRSSAGKFLLDALSELDIPVLQVSRAGRPLNPRLSSDRNYRIEVLWPPPADIAGDLDANDSSLVLRISDNFGKILLCGDIGLLPQQKLLDLESPDLLNADVLLLPHHGSVASILPAFIDAVNPQLCLSSDGKLQQNSFKKLRQILPHRKIIHTHLRGAVTTYLHANGVKTTCFHDSKGRL